MSTTTPVLILIDDNPEETNLVRQAFEDCARKVLFIHYHSPEEALQALSRPIPYEGARLILMDLYTPAVAGRHLVDHFAAMPHLNAVPVLVWSHSLRLSDAQRCLDRGAKDCLQKPASWVEYRELPVTLRPYWRGGDTSSFRNRALADPERTDRTPTE